MTSKSKFAGLAEARLKDIEAEGQAEIVEAPAPKQKAKKQAVKQVNKSTSRKTNKATTKEGKTKLASVSARTQEENRTWWIYQARLQKTTLQDAIVEALEKRFGLPKKTKVK